MGAKHCKKFEHVRDCPPNFYDLKAIDIDGKTFKFEELQSENKNDTHAYLIVNVASSCLLSERNYAGLMELMMQYEEQGLIVMLFPVNTLNYQERKCNQKVKAYINKKYNANFKIFAKSEINGKNANEVYRWLRLNSELAGGPNKAKRLSFPWNYGKFLINNKGTVEKFADGFKSPLVLEDDIHQALHGEKNPNLVPAIQ